MRQQQCFSDFVEGSQDAIPGLCCNLAWLRLQECDDDSVGGRVGVSHLRLNGLAKRQGLHQVGSWVFAFRHVITGDAQVPDGSQVEQGIGAGMDLSIRSVAGGGVPVFGCLPDPFKGRNGMSIVPFRPKLPSRLRARADGELG